MIRFLWSSEIERAAITWWRGPSESSLNPQLVMNILASWGFSRNSATAERSSLHLSSSVSAARQHSRSRARIRVSGAGGEWQGETLGRFQAHGQNRWEKWNYLHHCRTPTNPTSPPSPSQKEQRRTIWSRFKHLESVLIKMPQCNSVSSFWILETNLTLFSIKVYSTLCNCFLD